MSGNATPQNGLFNMLVGTYTTGASEGIYVFEFNQNNGTITRKSQISKVKNPSYLAISSDRKMVYAVNEINGDNAGFLSCFKFSPFSGNLEFISKEPSHGSDPCYAEINTSIIAVGNYSSGTAVIYELEPDGRIGRHLHTIVHHGKGANPDRQEGPHIHCTTFSQKGDYLYAVDLGTDTVMRYNVKEFFNSGKNKGVPAIETDPGAGPRHLIFNKTGTVAYLINELQASINVYDLSSSKPALRQNVPLIRNGFDGAASGGELQLSPCEKFLYASNRASANEMVVFEVGEYGLLKVIQHIDCGGRTPRHFTLSQNGKFVLVANKDSANISVFTRDTDSGKLTPAGIELEIDQPSFILLSPIDSHE